MIRKIGQLVFLSFLAGVYPALAAENSGKLWNRLSVDGYYGYYHFPGGLVRLDESIVQSPDKFWGGIRGLRLDFAVDNNWLVGLNLFKIESHGYGAWERNDTKSILAANGVDGKVNGKTDWDWQGFALEAERRFLKGDFRPYCRVGLGVGELAVNFRGRFAGHEKISGFNFPVEEPANDAIKRLMPVAAVEVGVRLMPLSGLVWSPAFFWNTGGYGPKIGVGWEF